MKKNKISFLLVLISLMVTAQERVVQIDFESGTFINNPKIPYEEAFGIIGEVGKEVSFVKVNIKPEGKDRVLQYYTWNRIASNTSETFNIVVPPVLKSNTAYDFEIVTYTTLSVSQKSQLLNDIEDKMRFFLANNLYYDGRNVQVNKPKRVYEQLNLLIKESFQYHESKNLIPIHAPSTMVLDDLNNQSDFKFGRFFKKTTRVEKSEIANDLINEKIDHLVALISSELTPFLNTEVVQHYRKVNVKSVETDREPFSLPVNFGMYAWNKTVNANNTETGNVEFTPGVGFTIPFKNRSKLAHQSRMIDSFGFSAGVLLRPVEDVNGTQFATPGVNLPIYTGLGLRMFRVARLNAGVLLLDEKGSNNFNKLTIIPTIGIAFELNLWMGIKR
jgi:hypothetical protein